jgi:hypothetical protein
MHRNVPLWLSPLPFLLFAVFLLLTHPSMAERRDLGGPSPVSSALPGAQSVVSPTSSLTVEALHPSLSAQAAAVPELSLEELGRLLVQAITGQSWSLLGALLAFGVVWLTRKVGARWWPWLGTDREECCSLCWAAPAPCWWRRSRAGSPLPSGCCFPA